MCVIGVKYGGHLAVTKVLILLHTINDGAEGTLTLVLLLRGIEAISNGQLYL